MPVNVRDHGVGRGRESKSKRAREQVSITFPRTDTSIKIQSHSPLSRVAHPSLRSSMVAPPHACHHPCQFQWARLVPPQPTGTRDHMANDEFVCLLMELSECKSIVSSLNPSWASLASAWRAKQCFREQVSVRSSRSHCIC